MLDAFLHMRQGNMIGCALVALASAVDLMLAEDCTLFFLHKQIFGKELFASILGQHFYSCVPIMHATTSSGSCIYFCQCPMVLNCIFLLELLWYVPQNRHHANRLEKQNILFGSIPHKKANAKPIPVQSYQQSVQCVYKH
jgi:hypothetical protein